MQSSRLMRWFPVFLCVLASCGTVEAQKTSLSIIRRDGGTVTVLAELARTAEERARGFMERERIPAGTGMLFVFEQDQILSFWMKNTPSALSIAYIDSSGVIREIHHMTPFSLSPVSSAVSVRYALEVPRGWFDSQGIAPGDRVALDGVHSAP
jgi:uncharacterized membrane protein (UPF0127 family)